VSLSGGQKQRISLARALIKDPAIVVLDDCLSAVDSKTEKEILGQLQQFLSGRTALVITHRLFTSLDFDQIIILEEGKIIEKGSHQELLARNGYYRFLYEHQRTDREPPHRQT
jgi:ATP-binding cassette subfamily B protein